MLPFCRFSESRLTEPLVAGWRPPRSTASWPSMKTQRSSSPVDANDAGDEAAVGRSRVLRDARVGAVAEDRSAESVSAVLGRDEVGREHDPPVAGGRRHRRRRVVRHKRSAAQSGVGGRREDGRCVVGARRGVGTGLVGRRERTVAGATCTHEDEQPTEPCACHDRPRLECAPPGGQPPVRHPALEGPCVRCPSGRSGASRRPRCPRREAARPGAGRLARRRGRWTDRPGTGRTRPRNASAFPRRRP